MRRAHDARHQPNGFVLTVVVIIIAAAFVTLAVAGSLRTLTQLESGVAVVMGGAVAVATDGCVEEALLQLRRDAAYPGGNVTVGDVGCTVAVSGSGASRTITATGTIGALSRTVTVGVAMSPFALTSWSE